jgi:hypothetical protein
MELRCWMRQIFFEIDSKTLFASRKNKNDIDVTYYTVIRIRM